MRILKVVESVSTCGLLGFVGFLGEGTGTLLSLVGMVFMLFLLLPLVMVHAPSVSRNRIASESESALGLRKLRSSYMPLHDCHTSLR